MLDMWSSLKRRGGRVCLSDDSAGNDLSRNHPTGSTLLVLFYHHKLDEETILQYVEYWMNNRNTNIRRKERERSGQSVKIRKGSELKSLIHRIEAELEASTG